MARLLSSRFDAAFGFGLRVMLLAALIGAPALA